MLAFHSGNARRASEALATEGRRVPESTLKDWRSNRYPERYREIEAAELPKRYARIAEQCEAAAERLGSLEDRLADQVEEPASELAPRDAAGALRNVSVAKAVNIDKASVIRGRPTEITGTIDVGELLRTLEQRFGDVIVREPADAHALEESAHTAVTEDPAGSDVGTGRDLNA